MFILIIEYHFKQFIPAQKIIDIACSTWKTKLAAMWANSIVLSKQLEITESFYKEMRKVCTDSQHTLFDSIFGKDVPEYTYKDGELVWVRSESVIWNLRYTTGIFNNSGLECYESQKKSGSTTYWQTYKPAPGIELPD